MALSFDQFLRHLTDSSLLSVDEVTSMLSTLSDEQRPNDGEALARELVKQKKLTKFQAEQLYAGKGKSLVLGNYVILDKLLRKRAAEEKGCWKRAAGKGCWKRLLEKAEEPLMVGARASQLQVERHEDSRKTSAGVL